MDTLARIRAQGHDSTVRADLSLIEKAVFARSLSNVGQSNDVFMTALTVGGTLLSRMLSVAQQV